MWLVTWIVLLLVALGVVAAGSWRLFVRVRALVATVGSCSAAVDDAGRTAEQRQQAWLTDRAADDDALRARLYELARPVPRPLATAPLHRGTDSPREALT